MDVSDVSRGMVLLLTIPLITTTWKKWFGPKEDAEQDKNKKDSEDGDGEDSEGTEDGTTTKKVEKAQADPDGYQVFKMPWSLSFSYSFNIREDRTKPINVIQCVIRLLIPQY